MAFIGDSLNQIQLLLRYLNTSSSNRDSIENLHSSFSADSNSDDSSSSSASNFTDDDSTNSDSDEYGVSAYPGILDVDLSTLTAEERTVFIVLVSVLFVLSLCGNIGTLFVNVRRKIRPFFRACLISLAISDLVSTIFLTTVYMSQFMAEYVQIWDLGSFMCGFVPFITTAAILASSMILVGIALDRYFAVMKAVVGFWNPDSTFCCICMSSIWAASIGIACPVFWIYVQIPVYILTEESVGGVESVGVNTTNTPIATRKPPNVIGPALVTSTIATTTSSFSWLQEASNENLTYILVREEKLVSMCLSGQRNVGLYYIIVFSIIFIPSIIAFIWLNSIIAKKLWIRRHTGHSKANKKFTKSFKPHWKSKSKSKSITNSFELINANIKVPNIAPMPPCNCKFGNHSINDNTLPAKAPETTVQAGGTNIAAATDNTTAPSRVTPTNANGNTSRESRHIRMFTIVILLMTVFLLFRLPAWIFLVMRLYGSYSTKVYWIIYFSFGILNLASCVLNPLFYTFLAQSITYITCLKVTLWDNYCGLRLCYEHGRRNSRIPSEAPTFMGKNGAPPEPQPHWSCGFCCSACGLPKSSFFYAGPPKRRGGSSQTEELPQVMIKQPPHMLKDDRDEGVDCGDVSDDGDSMNGFYNERVYTIFPVALVSSSMASESK